MSCQLCGRDRKTTVVHISNLQEIRTAKVHVPEVEIDEDFNLCEECKKFVSKLDVDRVR